MARSRNIKPGFFKNETLGELDPFARLLFAGLWTLADRDGRLEYRPKRIRAELFPYDDIDGAKLLDDLIAGGFLIRYQVDGLDCLQITNWKRHQTPHHKEVASELPPPPGVSKAPRRAGVDQARMDRGRPAIDPSTGQSWAKVGSSMVQDQSKHGSSTGQARLNIEPSMDQPRVKHGSSMDQPRSNVDPSMVPKVGPYPTDSLNLDPDTLNTDSLDISSELENPSSEPTPRKGRDPNEVILTFETNGITPTWELTREQLSEWSMCYPDFNVLAEVRKALAWIEANPTKRKTARGMPRFLVNWLNHANDRPRPSAGPRASPGGFSGPAIYPKSSGPALLKDRLRAFADTEDEIEIEIEEEPER